MNTSAAAAAQGPGYEMIVLLTFCLVHILKQRHCININALHCLAQWILILIHQRPEESAFALQEAAAAPCLHFLHCQLGRASERNKAKAGCRRRWLYMSDWCSYIKRVSLREPSAIPFVARQDWRRRALLNVLSKSRSTDIFARRRSKTSQTWKLMARQSI